MDPREYCQQAIEELRGSGGGRVSGLAAQQKLVVLAYFVQREPAETDFADQLRMLIDSAERTQRHTLASATRTILAEWEGRGEEGESASPSERPEGTLSL